MIVLPLQEAAERQHRHAQQVNIHPASSMAAERATAGNPPHKVSNPRFQPARQHVRMQQQLHCPDKQDGSDHCVNSSASSAVYVASAIQDQHTPAATDAAQGLADAKEVLAACPATANNTKSIDSRVNQSETEPTGLKAAEAAQAAVAEVTAVVHTSQTDAKGGHMQSDRQIDSSAACVQHNRPGDLVISQTRLEPEHAASGLQVKQHAQPSTPGAGQGLLQELPCTPGLVSSSSACCVLPRSCSSNGEDSSGSGLEAENSIRFRKRSKFEALKARREEARQKAEVIRKLVLCTQSVCDAVDRKHILHSFCTLLMSLSAHPRVSKPTQAHYLSGRPAQPKQTCLALQPDLLCSWTHNTYAIVCIFPSGCKFPVPTHPYAAKTRQVPSKNVEGHQCDL